MTADLRERVRRLAGMERLLPALEGLPPTYLVGGAVRDLLRGARRGRPRPRGRGRRALRRRGRSPSGSAARSREHERFGTATVRAGELVVRPRRHPRARPTPSPARCPTSSRPRWPRTSRRRDFTSTRWRSASPATTSATSTTRTAASATSRPRRIRVLHDRQLPRRPHPPPARRALRGPAGLRAWTPTPSGSRARRSPRARCRTVSGARVRDELLRPARRARGARAASSACATSASTARCTRRSSADPELVASAALGALAIGADRALAALAALCSAAPEAARPLARRLQLDARDRDAVSRAARVGRPAGAPSCARATTRPSELHALLRRRAARRRWPWRSPWAPRPSPSCAG